MSLQSRSEWIPDSEERARTAGYRVGAIADATGVTRQQLIRWLQLRICPTLQTWLRQLVPEGPTTVAGGQLAWRAQPPERARKGRSAPRRVAGKTGQRQRLEIQPYACPRTLSVRKNLRHAIPGAALAAR